MVCHCEERSDVAIFSTRLPRLLRRLAMIKEAVCHCEERSDAAIFCTNHIYCCIKNPAASRINGN